MAERLTLLAVYGTVREALALAPVVRALEADDRFHVITVSLGPHRPKESLIEILDLNPDYSLPGAQGLAEPGYENLTVLMKHLQSISAELEPDLLLIAGGDQVPAAAALLSGYQRLPLAHIGAGLRPTGLNGVSLSVRSPSGSIEEFHHRLISAAGQIHFAATRTGHGHLLRAGLPEASLYLTGDPLVDTAQTLLPRLNMESAAAAVGAGDRRTVLIAVENLTPDPYLLVDLYRAIRAVAARTADTLFIVQPPFTHGMKRLAARYLSDAEGVALVGRLTYERRWSLLARSYCAVTTGGPLEDEAASFSTPVLVLNDSTGRPERVELGGNRLVGRDARRLASNLFNLLRDPRRREAMAAGPNPYGDGAAGPRIAQAIGHCFDRAQRPAPFRMTAADF